MVRPAERTNSTNPVAERRFDSKIIIGAIAGLLLLLLIFFYLAPKWFSYGETRNTQSNSSRTQEDDKRAVP